MFTGYLKIEKDVRLFYKVYASTKDADERIAGDQPTLIFLHGGPGVVDHTLYKPFWSKFAGRIMADSTLQVIFIDQRGCGRSYQDKGSICDYGNPETWNLSQWGKDVRSFFTAFDIKQPIIAGVSFGGVVAMSCAVQFPTELGGLILSDTDAHFDLDDVLNHFAEKVNTKGGTSEEVTHVCNVARRMLTETSAESYADYVKICIPYCATNPYNAELISCCVKNEEVAYHYNRNELTSFNFLPDLKKIECQTLVITGDQNPVHTSKSAMKTAKALPEDKVTFKIFHGAGSPVYADKEAEVVEFISSYLDELSTNFRKKIKKL
ncbi:MAG: alpha/beta hydrolase [Tatlockia sp.]|nr:alpha/beta hydrolase [Tatlockia sp.]